MPKRYEITYSDPKIPQAEFLVVMPSKNARTAANELKSYGYKPLRVKLLRGWRMK